MDWYNCNLIVAGAQLCANLCAPLIHQWCVARHSAVGLLVLFLGFKFCSLTISPLFDSEALRVGYSIAAYAEAKKARISVLAGDGELLEYLTRQLFCTI